MAEADIEPEAPSLYAESAHWTKPLGLVEEDPVESSTPEE